MSEFYIIAQLLYQFLRGYALTGHPTSCSGHETDQHHDGISIHTCSRSHILAQDLIQFLKRDAFTEQPSFAGGNVTPAEQNGTTFYSDPWLIATADLYDFLQPYALPASESPPSGNGHETGQHHDGISIHADSRFRIPTQDQLQFLKQDAFTEQPLFAGGNETSAEQNDTLSYPASWLIPAADLYQFLQGHAHPASELPPSDNGHEIPAEQNDMPVDDPLLIPVESLSHVPQLHEIPPVLFSSDSGHETPAVQQLEDNSENDPMSRSVTPIQSQDSHDELEVDAQAASILHPCPVCQRPFRRVQERNRHVESYLPHSILCPSRGCTWTGRRQWDFQEHWRRKHKGAGQAPGEDANEIYDPGDFAGLIVGGTPVDEVARSAFAMVPEGLRRLGKPDVEVNVLGRNRDLKKWIRIRIPSSQLN